MIDLSGVKETNFVLRRVSDSSSTLFNAAMGSKKFIARPHCDSNAESSAVDHSSMVFSHGIITEN